ERAMERKLLTFVGSKLEETIQTQLTNAVMKALGAPYVLVKPGIFGLLRYPEGAVEPMPGDKEAEKPEKTEKEAAVPAPGSAEADREGRRRRRRGGRGGKGRREPRPGVQGGVEAAPVGGEMVSEERDDADR